jgi:hypothetical protein
MSMFDEDVDPGDGPAEPDAFQQAADEAVQELGTPGAEGEHDPGQLTPEQHALMTVDLFQNDINFRRQVLAQYDEEGRPRVPDHLVNRAAGRYPEELKWLARHNTAGTMEVIEAAAEPLLRRIDALEQALGMRQAPARAAQNRTTAGRSGARSGPDPHAVMRERDVDDRSAFMLAAMGALDDLGQTYQDFDDDMKLQFRETNRRFRQRGRGR